MSNVINFNLKQVGSSVIVSDFGSTYAYRRIIDPDGKDVQFYNFFYKHADSPSWFSVNGVLSENFTVCKTEEVIKRIKEILQSEVVEEKHFKESFTVKSSFILKDYELSDMEINEADRIIFKLTSGVDIQEIQNKTCLAFNVINGFAGNVALQLNYGFVTNYIANEKHLKISNLFILDEFSHRLIHNQNLDIKFEEVQNVKNNVENKIKQYKSMSADKEFIDGLELAIGKRLMKGFMATYDMLPAEFRNLYYITMIISSILEESESIFREISVRKFISEFCKKHTQG